MLQRVFLAKQLSYVSKVIINDIVIFQRAVNCVHCGNYCWSPLGLNNLMILVNEVKEECFEL